METKKSNNLVITIVSVSSLDKLAIGDIFLFSTTGPRYVFYGRTPDGRFLYVRIDNNRKYYRHRNRQVFNVNHNGGLYIANGELFIDFETAMSCATRL